MYDFEPKGKSWRERVNLEGDKAVLDPAGSIIKNRLIDKIHKAILVKEMKEIKKQNILDFGCGIGRLYSFLSSLDVEYIGIDVTAEMIAKARCLHDGIFLTYDGINLPLDDESIDVIVSVMVLQHINNTDEYNKLVTEFKRVLRKGGHVIFIEQISKDKPKTRYVDPFLKNDFIFKHFSLIRRGRSISSYLSAKRWFKFFPRKIIINLLFMLNKIENFMPSLKETYSECVFVF